MKTTLPISAINYCTPEFLSRKLNELVSSGALDFWAFVHHNPEGDGEQKSHNHLYVLPAKPVETPRLTAFIGTEILPDGSKVSTLPVWNKSKTFADWYLYAIHDEFYLRSKGEERIYHYSFDEVFSSSVDSLRQMVRDINYRPKLTQDLMEYFAKARTPWAEIMLSTSISPNQYMSFRTMYVDICSVLATETHHIGGAVNQDVVVPAKIPDYDGYVSVSVNDPSIPFNK